MIYCFTFLWPKCKCKSNIQIFKCLVLELLDHFGPKVWMDFSSFRSSGWRYAFKLTLFIIALLLSRSRSLRRPCGTNTRYYHYYYYYYYYYYSIQIPPKERDGWLWPTIILNTSLNNSYSHTVILTLLQPCWKQTIMCTSRLLFNKCLQRNLKVFINLLLDTWR